jgi:DNA polymerase-3 subunit chi
MTGVEFHSKVPDVVGYTCRLLRKAMRKGSRAAVTGPRDALAQLDRALWHFDPLEFIPHVRLPEGAKPEPRLAITPIWLVESIADAPVHEVLVNLGPAIAPGFESYERVLEIVGREPDAVQAGRVRWRHYKERGYALSNHEAGA